MTNQSRRTLLKGLAYGIALTASGASTAAIALTPNNKQKCALPTCDITIYHQQTSSKEIVSLMNLSGEAITLDGIKPVGLTHINGSIIIKLNHVSDGKITLAAGERLSFEIEALSTADQTVSQTGDLLIPNVVAGHVKITSDHPAFNGIIPVTVFDGQTAV